MTHKVTDGVLEFINKEGSPVGWYNPNDSVPLTVSTPRIKGPIMAYCKRLGLAMYADVEPTPFERATAVIETSKGENPPEIALGPRADTKNTDLIETEQPKSGKMYKVYGYTLPMDTKLFSKGQQVYVRWSQANPIRVSLRKDRIVGQRRNKAYDTLANELIVVGDNRRIPAPPLEVIEVDEQLFTKIAPVTLPDND